MWHRNGLNVLLTNAITPLVPLLPCWWLRAGVAKRTDPPSHIRQSSEVTELGFACWGLRLLPCGRHLQRLRASVLHLLKSWAPTGTPHSAEAPLCMPLPPGSGRWRRGGHSTSRTLTLKEPVGPPLVYSNIIVSVYICILTSTGPSYIISWITAHIQYCVLGNSLLCRGPGQLETSSRA